ncbi:unnamed protein product [Rotaria magnacalcarata]|uniref:Secreted protein n=1 Tax=Rotaria magnacalcarata TaxID=392030 RepID=A0A816UXM8_9BILA|nr:unnamed protein product [Rotaria magnacalcarata]
MKTPVTVFWSSVFAIVAISQHAIALPTYEMDDDSAHGMRIAGNDEFTVWASNAYERILISLAPYQTTIGCALAYQMHNLYVYSLDIIQNKDHNSPSKFYRIILVAEMMTNQDVYLIEIQLDSSDKDCGNISNKQVYTY